MIILSVLQYILLWYLNILNLRFSQTSQFTLSHLSKDSSSSNLLTILQLPICTLKSYYVKLFSRLFFCKVSPTHIQYIDAWKTSTFGVAYNLDNQLLARKCTYSSIPVCMCSTKDIMLFVFNTVSIIINIVMLLITLSETTAITKITALTTMAFTVCHYINYHNGSDRLLLRIHISE